MHVQERAQRTRRTGNNLLGLVEAEDVHELFGELLPPREPLLALAPPLLLARRLVVCALLGLVLIPCIVLVVPLARLAGRLAALLLLLRVAHVLERFAAALDRPVDGKDRALAQVALAASAAVPTSGRRRGRGRSRRRRRVLVAAVHARVAAQERRVGACALGARDDAG